MTHLTSMTKNLELMYRAFVFFHYGFPIIIRLVEGFFGN